MGLVVADVSVQMMVVPDETQCGCPQGKGRNAMSGDPLLQGGLRLGESRLKCEPVGRMGMHPWEGFRLRAIMGDTTASKQARQKRCRPTIDDGFVREVGSRERR